MGRKRTEYLKEKVAKYEAALKAERAKERRRQREQERREREARRKAETRRLILKGRIVEQWEQRDERMATKVLEAAKAFCLEDYDRQVFELPPLTEAEKDRRRQVREVRKDAGGSAGADSGRHDQGPRPPDRRGDTSSAARTAASSSATEAQLKQGSPRREEPTARPVRDASAARPDGSGGGGAAASRNAPVTAPRTASGQNGAAG